MIKANSVLTRVVSRTGTAARSSERIRASTIPADFQSLNFVPQSADLGGQRVVFVYVRCRWLGDCAHLVRVLADTIVRLVDFIRGPGQFLYGRPLQPGLP